MTKFYAGIQNKSFKKLLIVFSPAGIQKVRSSGRVGGRRDDTEALRDRRRQHLRAQAAQRWRSVLGVGHTASSGTVPRGFAHGACVPAQRTHNRRRGLHHEHPRGRAPQGRGHRHLQLHLVVIGKFLLFFYFLEGEKNKLINY